MDKAFLILITKKGGKSIKKIIKIIFILGAVVMMSACARRSNEEGILVSQDCLDAESKEEVELSEPKETEEIYVQVCGAVKHPGVYSLPQGSRVFQAVELAGGLSKEADAKSLNQAESLSDGQMIKVLTKEEAKALGDGPTNAGSTDDGKINLNTATREELLRLSGIGDAKADSILAWREQHGGFSQIEDLMKIEGIKEGVFSKIRDYVKVR